MTLLRGYSNRRSQTSHLLDAACAPGGESLPGGGKIESKSSCQHQTTTPATTVQPFSSLYLFIHTFISTVPRHCYATIHTVIITLCYIIDHGTKTHHIHRQHPRVISSEEYCSFVHRKSIPMYTSILSFHTVPFKLMLFREPTARFIKSTLVNIMLEHDSMRPIAANFLLSQPKPRSEQAT